MNILTKKNALLVALLAVLPWIACKQEQPKPSRVSSFGLYSGYSEARYDGYQRTSQYIQGRDGTKLAVDIFRPTKNGQVAQEPLPVIWTHTRYHRASIKDDGSVMTVLDASKWAVELMKHGYVVASMDTRGGGASFGTQPGFFSREETHDAYDFTEWLAAQPWSSGKIGMFGRSYLGITQYFAASEVPPHLKAIFPEMSGFEWYSFVYTGGIYRDDFLRQWGRLTKDLDGPKPEPLDFFKLRMLFPVAKVDEDKDGQLLAAAMRDHQKNRDIPQMFAPLHFRDSVDAVSKKNVYEERSPWTYAAGIEKSGVAIYHLAGWLDLFPRDTTLWFNNLHNPQKVVVGPWFHGGSEGLDFTAEHLRWYDYWLKGIDNGVMGEPAFHYWTMGAPKGQEWHATSRWPLPNEKPTQFFFQERGALDTTTVTSAQGQDDFKVDYSATTGTGNRWTAGYGGGIGYPDMAPNDKKGLTYTSAALTTPIEVTGHPVVHLWITSTASDGDFFVYLEEITPDGYSHYVTEGALRASHRAVTEAPYNVSGLPYHRSFAADVKPLPRGPVELAFDLHPTSKIFAVGNRIRVTITGADKDNTLTPKLSPVPTVSMYRNAGHASFITLPVIPAAGAPAPGVAR
jgi:putative CocE/NonD family hydrolase